MENDQSPNYKKIFQDIIKYKHPEKKEKCHSLLQKKKLTTKDVIMLNSYIFGSDIESNLSESNQKFRAYDQETVQYILKYQITNQLNNVQTANHFRISRNTLAKWKKMKM
ncbi:transposase [Chryseobacterium viscerum]|uniref:Helix-turn-helix domain-containing protein n=1 Tax=Chryseobacterium viscerum TaxID=1037377 RepID=A0A316WDL8_9FLAO|nr:transposase [Chryseobacterium viscerum]KAB1232263.1 helix-turn-helix domain-containing protein [Chryseobacterium viscerum]PWN59524.1 transposase [Chryseobacterium viscerum]